MHWNQGWVFISLPGFACQWLCFCLAVFFCVHHLGLRGWTPDTRQIIKVLLHSARVKLIFQDYHEINSCLYVCISVQYHPQLWDNWKTKNFKWYPIHFLFTTTKQKCLVIDFLIFGHMTCVCATQTDSTVAKRSRKYDKTAQTSRPIRSHTAAWPITVHWTWHAWEPMMPLMLNEESKFKR